MAGIRERLVQLTVRAREFLSKDIAPATDAMRDLSAEGRRLKAELAEAGRARGLVRTLRDTEGATGSLERAWRDAQSTLDDLTREVGDHEQATAGQRIALREARRTADEAKAAYDRSQRAIKNLRTELKGLGVDADNLGSEEDRLTAEINQNKQAVDDNREAIKQKRIEEKKAAEAAQEHASRVDAARGALASGAKQVLAFAAAFVGLNALMGAVGRGLDLVRSGIVTMLQTGDQFEGLQTRMNALMGSMAAGEAATAWVKDFATRTPLELQEVTDAFAQLQAYGVDPMNGTLQALVDQNEKLGGGMERLQGIISAVGQAYAKQKLQTEEILQLVERGVPVWDMLSKVTGKNAADLQELASKGKLGRDVLAALVKEIGRLSEGAAESNMGRLSGIISNLKDQVTDFYDRISKAGALEYVKGELKQLSDRISQMAADGSLDRLAKGLSDAFIKGVEKAKELAAGLKDIDFAELAGKAESAVEKIGAAVDSTVTAGRYAVAVLSTAWNAFSAVVNSTAATLIKAVQLTLGSLVLGAGQIAEFFGNEELKAKADGLYTFLGDLSAGYAEQAKTDLSQISSAWDINTQSVAASAREQTDALQTEADIQRQINQATADHLVANQQKVRDAYVQAAIDGQQAITDLANAQRLIDTASSVEQLEGLRKALLAAYQGGTLSMEAYGQASALLNDKLRTLKGGAEGAADGLSDLSDGFDDLQSILGDVRSAMNEVDFNRLRQGIRKAYTDGKISADEFAQAQKALNERITELKPAADAGARSVRDMGAEVEAGAGQAAAGFRSVGDAAEEASAQADFFGQVLTQAREPLAAMSEEALKAFDAMQGITSTDWGIDTSSAERTAEALEEVTRKAGEMQTELNKFGSLSSGFGVWMMQTLIRSKEVQASFLEQKLSLQRLLEGYEDGSRSLPEFLASAKSAQQSMKLLDESDLSQLESAIASAEQRMQQLGDASRNTLDGLRDELDRLQGNEEDIERRRYASRLRDLQAQLAEAQGAGDAVSVANLTQSLSVLRQIQTATEEQRARQNLEKQSQGAGGAAPQPAAQQPARIIRLETARGRVVDVSVADAQSETGLLDILADAGLRTL
ncbi:MULTISPECIES: tape measure protein [unclassified Pseudomonas]|uniref:tape measure protein n=1 Tax=unclassified Pseudomonas TaxID=196821 RepID=UPI00244C9E8A|nr:MULTISPECIES: tape measure protein [unclassified Pseudomonas]MDG9925432.1 tape measure protein [Pseudomonas sp. GD04045]MDH0034127.1 tape measure protein [Pseudomonas sp. GD04019]